MDESGDLAFSGKKGNSKVFIITFLAIQDKKVIEKIVKKVHQSLRKKVKKLSGGVLHAAKEKPATREKLLRLISVTSSAIMCVVLDKSKVYTRLQEEKHVLYNYVTNILVDRIIRKQLVASSEGVEIIASKRETNKFLNQNFKTYLLDQTQRKHRVNIKIEVKTPSEEKGLQAVDFVSWAMYQKHEKGDTKSHNLIQKLIREENTLFK